MEDLDALMHMVWQDERLDVAEKKQLRNTLSSVNVESRGYFRNCCFRTAEEKISAGENAARVLATLHKIIRILETLPSPSEATAYFSPGSACRDAILHAIEHARSRVDVCVFTISDNILSAALIQAHKRGVAVRIISDNDKSHDMGSDIDTLINNELTVVMDVSNYHMHHKFALIDDALINGSFNWTRSATEKNQENIIVTQEVALVAAFEGTFNELWRRFTHITL